jgi:outer membrane protein assembly factor BamB
MKTPLPLLLPLLLAAGLLLSQGETPDLGTRKAGQDWPCFLGPTGDGKSTETGILAPWPESGLKIAWQTALGEGYATCAVSKGRCFLFDRLANEVRIRALQSETGRLLWEKRFPTKYVDQFGYDGGPRTAPVADGERVYLYGADGWLRCLAMADGQLLWEHDVLKEYDVVPNFFGVGCSPVVENELLIVPVGGSLPGSDAARFPELKGNGTGLVAFDCHSGKERWRGCNELASYASPRIVTGPDGKRRGYWFARGGLVGFEPTTGRQTFYFPWRARLLESVNASSPVIMDDRVFVTECYGPGGVLVQNISAGAPEVVWSDKDKGRQQSLASHWATPIYHEGYLYGCHSRHTGDAELRCVEWATGAVKWRQRDLGRTSMLFVDGHLVVLTEEGQLLLLKASPNRFELVSAWQPKAPQGHATVRPVPLLEYPAWAAPLLAHGLLYVRGRDRLLCLELVPPGR